MPNPYFSIEQPAPVDELANLMQRLQARLLMELDSSNWPDRYQIRKMASAIFRALLTEENITISQEEQDRIESLVIANLLGFGPIDLFLTDDSISQIIVPGDNKILIERGGKIEATSVRFQDQTHLEKILDRILAPLGISDTRRPVVRARLPDGSQVMIVRTVNRIQVFIKKFPKRPLTIDDLIRFGTFTPEMAEFLRACFIAKLNILLCGKPNTGKTTLLNAFSAFIPMDERLISLETIYELQLRLERVIPVEGFDMNIDVLHRLFDHRPDCFVFGKIDVDSVPAFIHSALALPTIATLTSADAEAAFHILELGLLNTMPEFSSTAVRSMIIQAIDLVVVMGKDLEGRIFISAILEPLLSEDNKLSLKSIFIRQGDMVHSKAKPSFMPKFEASGIYVPDSLFGLNL